MDNVEVPDDFATLFIIGLPVQEDDIRALFSAVGTITELKLLERKDESKPGCAGVVTMSSNAEARAVMEHFKYLDIEETGRRMKISWDSRSLERHQRNSKNDIEVPDDFAILWAMGLPIDEEDVRATFSTVGTVVDMKILPLKEGKESRVGSITMGSKKEALAAMEHFKYLDMPHTGRRMRLEWDPRSMERLGLSIPQRSFGGGFGSSSGATTGFGSSSGGGFGSPGGGGGGGFGSSNGGGFGERSGGFGSSGGATTGFGSSGGDGFGEKRRGFGDHSGGVDASVISGFGGSNGGGGGGSGGRFGDRKEGGAGFGRRFGNDSDRNGGGDTDGEVRAPVTYIPAENLSRDELRREHNVAGINFNKYKEVGVEVSGENVPPPVETFDRSGLGALVLGAVTFMGYDTPTPVQKYCIPVVLGKRDLMACAQTGSGKTAAYLLPIINNLLTEGVRPPVAEGRAHPEVLVVCPTRELAVQVEKEACVYVEGSGLKTASVYGQTEVGHMRRGLCRGVNVVSATTGRLMQCLRSGWIRLDRLKYLVLDEADRMLDMGFSADIEAIVGHATMPKERVTLMFSATFAPDIQQMAGRFLKDYVFVATGIVGGACGDVTQRVLKCQGRAEKKEMLEELLRSRAHTDNKGNLVYEKTLIFCETKTETDKIGLELGVNGISSTTIHGDRQQDQRESALADFKAGRKAVLVATNVAARGLDIPDVKHVINWDLPRTSDEMSEYVHRIGRTGRVGNEGVATTFYSQKCRAVAPKLLQIMLAAKSPVPDWLYEEAGMAVPSGNAVAVGSGDGGNLGFGARDTREPVGERPSVPEEDSAASFSRTRVLVEDEGGKEQKEEPRRTFGSGGSAVEQTVESNGGGDSGGVPVPAPVSRFGGFGRRAALNR